MIDTRVDETHGYKVKIDIANTRHRFPNLKSSYEFETLNEVLAFLLKEMGVNDMNITKIDSEKDYGIIANTSWYMVIKKYRDVPDFMLF